MCPFFKGSTTHHRVVDKSNLELCTFDNKLINQYTNCRLKMKLLSGRFEQLVVPNESLSCSVDLGANVLVVEFFLE